MVGVTAVGEGGGSVHVGDETGEAVVVTSDWAVGGIVGGIEMVTEGDEVRLDE